VVEDNEDDTQRKNSFVVTKQGTIKNRITNYIIIRGLTGNVLS